MKIHEIFPILISQDKIDNHDEIKNEYLGELKSLWWNGVLDSRRRFKYKS